MGEDGGWARGINIKKKGFEKMGEWERKDKEGEESRNNKIRAIIYIYIYVYNINRINIIK